MPADLARIFPQLESAPYEVTSPEDVKYNCVPWAAGPAEVRRKWWPAPSPFYYWPVEPREETVAGFIRAFGQLGYAVCDAGDLDPGYEGWQSTLTKPARPRTWRGNYPPDTGRASWAN